MLNQLIKKPILSCSIIFVICSVARLIEYFYMRTDETFLSENFHINFLNSSTMGVFQFVI